VLVLRYTLSVVFGSGLSSGAVAGWINGHFAGFAGASFVYVAVFFVLTVLFVAAATTSLRRAMRLARVSGHAVAKFRQRLHRSVQMTKADGNQRPSPSLRLR
jgi:uncharacterized membrane protein YjjP (DUF1212 family)